jgi:imidazolonepropionase-like amidohydrolase
MILIKGATLIDGTGGAPLPASAIAIEGDRLKWVGRAADLDKAWVFDRTVDAAGKFIIPGLIEAHTHICWDGREAGHIAASRNAYESVLVAIQQVGRILNTGVTSVRDVGGDRHVDIFVKRAIQAGELIGPRLMVSGDYLCRTGGHGWFSGCEVDGVEEMRKGVRKQIKAGADMIKIMVTGGLATPGANINLVQLTDEEIRTAAEEARRFEMITAAHCHTLPGITAAVRNGVYTIEHGLFTDEKAADLMAKHGAMLVMTIKKFSAAEQVLPGLKNYKENIEPKASNVIRILRERNVPMALGTDDVMQGDGLPFVMDAMVKYGASPMETIVFATLNGAKAMARQDRVGSIEAGKLADLVILNSDPLAKIGNVRDISAIYLGGATVKRPVNPVVI